MKRIFTFALWRTHIMKTRFVRNISFNFAKSIFLALALCLFPSCLSDFGWGTRGDVDLSKATWLVTEKVPLISDKGGIPGAPPTSGGGTVFNNLFSLPPGTKVKASALGGTIDPTGTTIINDFDGDGILNINETTTNVWVADYPMVESVIAPPITMKIAIKVSTSGSSSEISSDITSDDFESGKSQGSEKIHQNELNLRTVQFQDQYSTSGELSQSQGASVSIGANVSVGAMGMTAAGAGFNYSASTESSWSAKNSLSMTTTKWADQPFKNNIDSNAFNLKSNSSSQNARKFRSEKSNKVDTSSQIDSDAGYVRAALYIKNNSVNMPVKLKNILCSLMFETPTGELIPVTSFRLKNDDYSIFEIDVYGGTEFGPYVIEVDHLNRAEVERAIASGYNPKIFIVDYEMTHVADSNYKSSLLNFSGDNLKVIEENAKGRTALIKIIGPNLREMYRVAAFEAVGGSENPCNTQSATQLSPGVSLKSALDRIACSGMEIEYQDYVLDFSEIAPTLSESKLHLKGIKNLAGLKTNLPCVPDTKTGSDSVSRTACVQKPYADWTETEKANAGIWAIFSKGKYYAPTAYFLDGSGPNATPREFDPFGTTPALMVKGPESIIWAGDSYDIVYLSFKDLAAKQQQFGTNPLETNEAYYLNTAWDLGELGKHPYYPDTHSLFLGDAGFGEKVQLQIKLNETNYLSPNFGTPADGGLAQYFTDFSYNYKKPTNLFDINQALDFEISLGFGGTRTDWLHVIKDINAGDDFKMTDCGRTLDFTSQTYYLCIQLPKDHPVVDPNISLIKLYIRPALNSAYRRTVWPLKYSEVRKVQGTLFAPAYTGDTSVLVSNSSIITDGGSMYQTGDSLKIFGDPKTYTVNSVVEQLCEPDTPNTAMCKRVYLTSAIAKTSRKTSSVYVMAGLTSPIMKLSVDTGFFSDWNTTTPITPTGSWETPQYLSLITGNGTVNCSTTFFHPSCLGLSPDYMTLNWMGAYNQGVAHANSWADGGNFLNFLSTGLFQLFANATSGITKSFRLETNNTDFTVSQDSGTTFNPPINVNVGNGVSVLVWKKDTNLYSRNYDIKTGSPLSDQILLNSGTPATGRVVAAGGSGKTIVLYEATATNSNDNVNYVIVSAEQGNSSNILTSGNLANNRSAILSGEVTIAISMMNESRGIFAISIPFVNVDTKYHNLFLRAFDLSNSPVTFSSGNFYISDDLSAANSGSPKIQISVNGTGNSTKAQLSWVYSKTSTNYSILTKAITVDGTLNMSAGEGATQSIVTNATGAMPTLYSTAASVSSSNGDLGRGIVAWVDASGNTTARGFNIDNSSLLGGSNISVESGLDSLRLTATNEYGLFSYTKTNRVYVRGFKLYDGTLWGSGALALDSSTTATSRKAGDASITFLPYANTATLVPKFLVTWEHLEGGVRYLRGRIGNLSSFTTEGSGEFYVSKITQGTHTSPASAIYTWDENISGGTVKKSKAIIGSVFQGSPQSSIRGYSMNILFPSDLPYGMNNFFVAPLIERDYSIKAKITY